MRSARARRRDMSRSRQALNRPRLAFEIPGEPADDFEQRDVAAPVFVYRVVKREDGLLANVFFAGASSIARAMEIARAHPNRAVVTLRAGRVEFDNGKPIASEG